MVVFATLRYPASWRETRTEIQVLANTQSTTTKLANATPDNLLPLVALDINRTIGKET